MFLLRIPLHGQAQTTKKKQNKKKTTTTNSNYVNWCVGGNVFLTERLIDFHSKVGNLF